MNKNRNPSFLHIVSPVLPVTLFYVTPAGQDSLGHRPYLLQSNFLFSAVIVTVLRNRQASISIFTGRSNLERFSSFPESQSLKVLELGLAPRTHASGLVGLISIHFYWKLVPGWIGSACKSVRGPKLSLRLHSCSLISSVPPFQVS